MSQWIRTADKLPTDNDDDMLAFDPELGIVMAYYESANAYEKSRWWCDHAGTIQPTHWMPLPEPPQTEDHELPPAESPTE